VHEVISTSLYHLRALPQRANATPSHYTPKREVFRNFEEATRIKAALSAQCAESILLCVFEHIMLKRQVGTVVAHDHNDSSRFIELTLKSFKYSMVFATQEVVSIVDYIIAKRRRKHMKP
jgi:hypothetical protein